MEIPRFNSEDEERNFWAIHDSVGFIEGTDPISFEYEEGNSNITGSNPQTRFYFKRWDIK